MPPPPPPPPPPLPFSSNSTNASADRSGLLSEIGNFRKGGLKKAVTNDRSAPLVGSSSNNNTRNSNRSSINERPCTVPLITPNQLNVTMLKPSGTSGSTVKVKKPSVSQITPPPPPPPPVHQPVVKIPVIDQSRNGGADHVNSTRSFTHQPPRLPPREPPPPPPSIETKPKLGQLSSSSMGSQQRITRAPPPPPPPPYSSTNNGHTFSDNTSKVFKSMNPNGPPPPPPPPPRGVVSATSNGSVRRPPSDFVENSFSDRSALDYDHHFEARYRFTPLEQLPIPERWQPPPTHTRSAKHHVNVR